MFTFIEESLTFSPEQKKAITNNLKRDLKSFDEHKVAAESQRYKKPWVQSTELSDVIADISRQSEAIIHSINKTISRFANRSVSQQQDNNYLTSIAEDRSVSQQQNNYLTSIAEDRSVSQQHDNYLTSIAELTCKDVFNPATSCTDDDKYRTADGSCNNLLNPSFGAARIAMKRFAAPAYTDSM